MPQTIRADLTSWLASVLQEPSYASAWAEKLWSDADPTGGPDTVFEISGTKTRSGNPETYTVSSAALLAELGE